MYSLFIRRFVFDIYLNDETVKFVTAAQQINNGIQNPHHGIKEKLFLTKDFQNYKPCLRFSEPSWNYLIDSKEKNKTFWKTP